MTQKAANPLGPAWLPALLAAAALALRLLHLQHQPLWFDEVLTWQRAHLDWAGLVHDSFANRHMPSYFLLLRGLSHLTGGAVALRLPSALFGAATVAVVFAIANRLAGRAAGIAAALLIALSPQQVQYGQEARAYTLVMLLVAIALWGVVRIAASPSPAEAKSGWRAYLLGTAAALDVLGNTLPWPLAANLVFLLLWRRLPAGSPQRQDFTRAWRRAHLALAALTLPAYALLLAAGDGNMLEKFNWVPHLSWHGIWVSFASAYLMRASAVVDLSLLPAAVPALAALVALAAAAGIWRLRRRPEGLAVVLGFALLPALVLAISLARPLLVPRYLLWSTPAFFALAGVGIAGLPRRALPAALPALALAAAVNLVPLYHTETKPRWDLATARLAPRVGPKDTILVDDPSARTMLLGPHRGPAFVREAVITPSVDVALARRKQGGKVWVVAGRSGLGQKPDPAALATRLSPLGTPASSMHLGQEITILVYLPAAPATLPDPG